MARGWARLALSLLVSLTLPAGAAIAETLVGGQVRLEAGTLSGGGATALQNTGSGATDTMGVSVGQSEALGVMQGSSGVVLEPGFWPATRVPEPSSWALGLAALGALGLLARHRTDA